MSADDRRQSPRLELEGLDTVVLVTAKGDRLVGRLEDFSPHGIRVGRNVGETTGKAPSGNGRGAAKSLLKPRVHVRIESCSCLLEDVLLGKECEVRWANGACCGLRFISPIDSLPDEFDEAEEGEALSGSRDDLYSW
jgi:hypothetical protein